jgi:hypothetical protein
MVTTPILRKRHAILQCLGIELDSLPTLGKILRLWKRRNSKAETVNGGLTSAARAVKLLQGCPDPERSIPGPVTFSFAARRDFPSVDNACELEESGNFEKKSHHLRVASAG